MKPRIIKFLATLACITWFSISVIAQPPPPDHGEDEDQPAPIGSGLVVLLALGAAYGAKKIYDIRGPCK